MRNYDMEDAKSTGAPRTSVREENVTDIMKTLDKDG